MANPASSGQRPLHLPVQTSASQPADLQESLSPKGEPEILTACQTENLDANTKPDIALNNRTTALCATTASSSSDNSPTPVETTRHLRLFEHSFDPHPLKLHDDDKILVICSDDHQGIGELTDKGAERLSEEIPELFPTASDAMNVFTDLTLAMEGCYRGINTQEYQAIARLIQNCKADNTLRVILKCEKSFWNKTEPESSASVREIPFGMYNAGFLHFYEYDGIYHPSRLCHRQYSRHLDELKFTSNLHEVLMRDDWTAEKKVQTLLLLFPCEPKQMTFDELLRNADFLIGDTYKKAEQSFLAQQQKEQ